MPADLPHPGLPTQPAQRLGRFAGSVWFSHHQCLEEPQRLDPVGATVLPQMARAIYVADDPLSLSRLDVIV